MSYNSNPTWAPVNDECLRSIACPSCDIHLVQQSLDEENPLYTNTYYHHRHIPPEIYMVCRNEECDLCEVDVVVKLRATLEVIELHEVN